MYIISGKVTNAPVDSLIVVNESKSLLNIE